MRLVREGRRKRNAAGSPARRENQRWGVVRGEAGGKVGEGEGREGETWALCYASQMLFAGQRLAMNLPC